MGLVCRVSLFPLPDRANHVDEMFIMGSVRCFFGLRLLPSLSERAHRLLASSCVRFTSNVKRFRGVTPYYVPLRVAAPELRFFAIISVDKRN